ncbi:ParB/RepB/Spo0J family partition protein [Ancylobacter oerskovii]|uniref:ParB/RepB/Spo0J family partition protein n=1 Tax=Ancylobacter oerskovii TaxID=459519 RepID=A0ABW4Z6C7_9HYPH|nr:ParB/RepB/Spo0J family partition protein [Ancylobacter oerskovii]MBS7545556.1 ParB/RepB/Spo0J family partition protein [Ancylobacter oerskovii]
MNNKLNLSGLDKFSHLMQAGADAASAAGKPLSLPLDRVAEDPRNARKNYDPAKLQELADSIRAGGLSTPIVVKVHPDDPKRYQIVHGHRRYRAHKLIEATIIEAVVTDKQGAVSQLVDNLQREDLTTAELVGGIRDLLADGLKQTEIAQKLGKSKAWVSKHAALTELADVAPELQDLLDSERIRDASTLYEALQCYKQDADAVRAFLATTGDRQVVQADIEGLRAAMKRGSEPAATTGGNATSDAPTSDAGASTAPPAATDGAGQDGSDTSGTPLAQVFSGNAAAGSQSDGDGEATTLAQVYTETRTDAAISSQAGGEGVTSDPSDDEDDDPDGDGQRRQSVKPGPAAPDPMKVRKPLVQVRVGRREGVMLIGKTAQYGLAWVKFENGDEEQLDVNKIKLVAVIDGASK